MQIILLEDVSKLGKKDQVLNVAEGYARNFLIPKGLAMEASQGKLKDLAKQKKIQSDQRQHQEAAARELAGRLEGLKLTIQTKAGEAGKLFGAVNNKDIADRLQKEQGIEIDKKKIILKTPIKTLGEHEITVKLFHSVQAQIKVEIIS